MAGTSAPHHQPVKQSTISSAKARARSVATPPTERRLSPLRTSAGPCSLLRRSVPRPVSIRGPSAPWDVGVESRAAGTTEPFGVSGGCLLRVCEWIGKKQGERKKSERLSNLHSGPPRMNRFLKPANPQAQHNHVHAHEQESRERLQRAAGVAAPMRLCALRMYVSMMIRSALASTRLPSRKSSIVS